MSSDSSLSLGPVARTPRLSDLVREQLLDAIRQADLPAGAKLPSERELAEQFGVSRTVVREAVRDLAAKGVLDVRSGAGARVSDTDDDGLGQSLALFLRRRNLLDPQKIHEVRETLELQTTLLAAERASDEDLAAIRAAFETMKAAADDARAASEADVEFHRAIARAANNELYLVLVDSLSDVLMEIRLATLARPGRSAAAIQQHQRVVEALEQRDPQLAVQAMRDHLTDSLAAFRQAVDD
jgi:GntR family transcriptional repressor for pyruvate dehydrogenase complex